MEVKAVLSTVPEGKIISYYKKREGRKAQRFTGPVVDKHNSGEIGVMINGNVEYMVRHMEVYLDEGPNKSDPISRSIRASRKSIEPSYTFE